MTGWLEKCVKCQPADSEFLTILLLTEKVMKNQTLRLDRIAAICGVSHLQPAGNASKKYGRLICWSVPFVMVK